MFNKVIYTVSKHASTAGGVPTASGTFTAGMRVAACVEVRVHLKTVLSVYPTLDEYNARLEVVIRHGVKYG